MIVRPRSCERAAEFVSLELDGELSVFERAMLKHHLQRCERCAAFSQEVTGFTELLRSTTNEPIQLEVPLSLRRYRIARVRHNVAAVAAVAAVGLWVAFSSLGTTGGAGHFGTVSPSSERAAAVSSDSYDWAAGLPHTDDVVQLFPGGLYTSGTNF